MVAARPGWDAITAVQNGAIYAVPAELYSTFGPRMVLGLEELANKLHPDRFPVSERLTLAEPSFVIP
jgi:iron complex transport system substrate-binding protein